MICDILNNMKIRFFLFLMTVFSLAGCAKIFDSSSIDSPLSPSSAVTDTIADHRIMRQIYDQNVPESVLQDAIDTLKIGYGRTSHGTQITSGMSGLVAFSNANFNNYSDNLFSWSRDGSVGLHVFEGSGYQDGFLDHDCGYVGWDDKTRTYLNAHPECNVIMWSWCGQVWKVDIQSHYLDNMIALEQEYPNVDFIYMTGHIDEGSDDPDTNMILANNNIIRNHCRENQKWLFDFADIEKYNLDGVYFGDKLVTDGCYYDSDNSGDIDTNLDANWAHEWQDSHTIDIEWYNCSSAHSEAVNANQKAYAVWWLFARIAGWDGK